jgi:hypothetical protein
MRDVRKSRLEVTEVGLRCFGAAKGAWMIRWSSIQEIEGFKRDLITTDLICLLIKYEEDSEKVMEIEINEDIEGFLDVERELQRRGFLGSSWREWVTLPPFQERRFLLFTSAARRA